MDFCKFEESTVTLLSAAAAAKSLQSCPTLCYPIDGSPPGSSVLGILQAKILEWVAISFSNACMHACMPSHFSRVQLCATLWTAAHQASPSTGFSRQAYCSGLPFPSPKSPACWLFCEYLRPGIHIQAWHARISVSSWGARLGPGH